MSLKDFKDIISSNIRLYDIQHYSNRNIDGGWKISIQGKVVEHGQFLLDRLYEFLIQNDIPFKVGTLRRYELLQLTDWRKKEQGHKCMTIYCPTDMNIHTLSDEVYKRVMDYSGWHDIKTPTSYEHYAGGLFIRNDRDSSGNYIKAN
ncbi:hypothetical protein [Vibrio owensii]|uniref:hypothetical protein n=1 Tax=Vibrio harveyi group TaxID=717610 RepID=UPI003CC657ED